MHSFVLETVVGHFPAAWSEPRRATVVMSWRQRLNLQRRKLGRKSRTTGTPDPGVGVSPTAQRRFLRLQWLKPGPQARSGSTSPKRNNNMIISCCAHQLVRSVPMTLQLAVILLIFLFSDGAHTALRSCILFLRLCQW